MSEWPSNFIVFLNLFCFPNACVIVSAILILYKNYRGLATTYNISIPSKYENFRVMFSNTVKLS